MSMSINDPSYILNWWYFRSCGYKLPTLRIYKASLSTSAIRGREDLGVISSI